MFGFLKSGWSTSCFSEANSGAIQVLVPFYLISQDVRVVHINGSDLSHREGTGSNSITYIPIEYRELDSYAGWTCHLYFSPSIFHPIWWLELSYFIMLLLKHCSAEKLLFGFMTSEAEGLHAPSFHGFFYFCGINVVRVLNYIKYTSWQLSVTFWTHYAVNRSEYGWQQKIVIPILWSVISTMQLSYIII